jgi:nudix-type nucleoside diphosphatase (YffH/AdpP family)
MGGQADRVVGVRKLYSGWLSLLLVDVRLGGEATTRPAIEHPSGVALLAYDPRRRLALTVEQTRVPLLMLGAARLAEPVAGVAEDETAEAAAARECREETGLTPRRLEPVGRVWMTPGSTTERVDLFLAAYDEQDLARGDGGGGAEGELEDIEVRERPLNELWREAFGGQRADAKLVLLLQALRLRRPELFAGV